MQKLIYIVFFSKGGNTRNLAKRIFDQFRQFMPKDVELKLMDLGKEYNFEALKGAAGFIIGTPDYFSYPAGQVKIIFDDLYDVRKEINGRPGFGFVTYGGSGKAEKPLVELMKSCGIKVIGPTLMQKEDTFSEKLEGTIQKNCEALLKGLN